MARINTGTMTVGIFAVLFGLIGAYALRAALVGEEPEPPPQPRRVSVPLAAYDLPAGRRLTISDMGIVPMTHDEMTARKYPLETLMVDSSQVEGRILKAPLKQGQPFLTTALYPEGDGPNVADRLKPGLRAITISSDDISSVGASVIDGSFVDVLFRSTPKPAPNDDSIEIPQETITLIQGAEVLQVGLNMAAGRRDPNATIDVRNSNRPVNTNAVRFITLAVTPEQAQVIETVRGRGDIRLDLRSPNDPHSKSIDPLTLEKLLGLKPVERTTLDIFRGTTRQTVTYKDNELIQENFGGYPSKSVFPGISPNDNQNQNQNPGPDTRGASNTQPRRTPGQDISDAVIYGLDGAPMYLRDVLVPTMTQTPVPF